LLKQETLLKQRPQRGRTFLFAVTGVISGSENISIGRISLRFVVFGGLMFSTFPTLFILPAVYTYLSRHKINVKDEYDVKVSDLAIED